MPRLTLFAALGAVIVRGRGHREVFELFQPGIDIDAESLQIGLTGQSDLVSLDDLYPDAVACLRTLADQDYRLGIVGNQPAPAAGVLTAMDVHLDLVATSAAWGVQKPEPEFFARIASELRLPPARIAYVGDRLDNDVRPARKAGMLAVFVRRGPWAWIQAGRDNPSEAAIVIERLADLPEALERWSRERAVAPPVKPRRSRSREEGS
jgi:FMN phosphatase YigB (HAD superfamily)